MSPKTTRNNQKAVVHTRSLKLEVQLKELQLEGSWMPPRSGEKTVTLTAEKCCNDFPSSRMSLNIKEWASVVSACQSPTGSRWCSSGLATLCRSLQADCRMPTRLLPTGVGIQIKQTTTAARKVATTGNSKQPFSHSYMAGRFEYSRLSLAATIWFAISFFSGVLACESECMTGVTNAFNGNYTIPVELTILSLVSVASPI